MACLKITATHQGTGNTFLTIEPGVSSSNYAVYTIPAGKTGYLVRYIAQARKGNATANAAGTFYVGLDGFAPRYRRPWYVSNSKTMVIEPWGGNRFPEKTDIAMVVTEVTSNNTAIIGGFDLVLIDNA